MLRSGGDRATSRRPATTTPRRTGSARRTPYANSMADWARMNVLGARAAKSFSAEPDIAEWSSRVALNPARIPPGHPGSDALDHARERLAAHAPAGVARLARLAELV